MCQEIPRGYSRKRENVKVLTNSWEQRGQNQNDKNTTLKTKKQMNSNPLKRVKYKFTKIKLLKKCQYQLRSNPLTTSSI